MKNHIKNLFMLPALIAGLGLMLANSVTAQTCTNLHNFTGSDGANPKAGLILSGNTLYGTAEYGGTNGNGSVFAINTDGSGFTILHSFTVEIQDYEGSFLFQQSGIPDPVYIYTNSDGANPSAGLILSGNTLYGTASAGGVSGNGTVFAINIDGTGFTNLYSFTGFNPSVLIYTNSDGANPTAGLILSGNTLYGTASAGGISGNGTVFAVNTNGTGFMKLHTFTKTEPDSGINIDGVNPASGLILSDNTLYGTASYGGSSGVGTVFALNINNMSFTNLHSFAGTANDEGAIPLAGLILSGNTLYGTTRVGGSSGNGTIFAVNTNGTGFTNYYSFTADIGLNFLPNTDGAHPLAGLILSGNTLYGTASWAGAGVGTVFAINTDSTGFTVLYRFTGDAGLEPEAGLILSGNTLYGTAAYGGSSNNGTVYSLSLPLPQLTINHSGTNVILTWPTNGTGIDYSGFTLQSNTNLVSPAGWSTVVPLQSVVNGLNTVTNPIFGTQQFYRLYQSMALITSGSFTMGDTLDGESDAIPTNVYVSAFYMDVNLVTYSQWQSLYNWATNNGYNFADAGSGKAANYPVEKVDWFDAIKWCNARSQQAGLTPVYYADTNLTQVYTIGETTNLFANWTADGYRLPTEAEWEKAARGGLSGQRFPWGNTISESQANYNPRYSESYAYDLGGAQIYGTGAYPWTSPVGSFPANSYGLNDMAGNVFEWCWDWYASTPYPTGSPYLGGTDPRGPVGPVGNPGYHVVRGGAWDADAFSARCAARVYVSPNGLGYFFGFRCVKGY